MSPPSPWDIQVKPKKLFSDETIVVEVPDTAIIEVLFFRLFEYLV